MVLWVKLYLTGCEPGVLRAIWKTEEEARFQWYPAFADDLVTVQDSRQSFVRCSKLLQLTLALSFCSKGVNTFTRYCTGDLASAHATKIACSGLMQSDVSSSIELGMRSILFSPQTHTHIHFHVFHGETGCQQRVPPLPRSLTATVRSSRWGAIKPDNKHSPSIPVCCCCCCCCRWCRAGGSSPATSVLTSTWVKHRSEQKRESPPNVTGKRPVPDDGGEKKNNKKMTRSEC